MCRSDTDVKSALQAWCAYGQPGSAPPADLFQPTNPLQRAFAASKGKAAPTAASSASGQVQQGQVGELSSFFSMMRIALRSVLFIAFADHRLLISVFCHRAVDISVFCGQE